MCLLIFTQPFLGPHEDNGACHIPTYRNKREFIKTIKVWFSRCFNSSFTFPFRRYRGDVSAQLSQLIPCGRSSCSPASTECLWVFKRLVSTGRCAVVFLQLERKAHDKRWYSAFYLRCIKLPGQTQRCKKVRKKTEYLCTNPLLFHQRSQMLKM